jgi:hypothetical protein
MKRRLLTVSLWIVLGCLFLAAASLALGLTRPSWYGRSHVVAGVIGGRIELAWSDGQLTRQKIAWGMQSPQGSASILVAPSSVWRPSVSRAAIGTSPGPGAGSLFRLTVVYVPLWPVIVVSAGAAGLLSLARGRARIPGRCRCGYDLRGLVGDTCPECGSSIGSVAARLMLMVHRFSRQRPGAGRRSRLPSPC